MTRGVGELSYDPAACPAPSVVVIVKPQVDPPAEVYERGVTVALVSIVRNHPGSVNPLIKSNNLLNNALAMQEAVRRGAFEGVMRNYRGELAECTTVEPLRREERRRADAAARRRPAAGHHARVPVRGRRRGGHSGPRSGPARRRPVRRRRSVPHQHDARARADRPRSTTASIGTGAAGTGDARAVAGLSEEGHGERTGCSAGLRPEGLRYI